MIDLYQAPSRTHTTAPPSVGAVRNSTEWQRLPLEQQSASALCDGDSQINRRVKMRGMAGCAGSVFITKHREITEKQERRNMSNETREKLEKLGEAAMLLPPEKQDYILGYADAVKDLRPDREQEQKAG